MNEYECEYEFNHHSNEKQNYECCYQTNNV